MEDYLSLSEAFDAQFKHVKFDQRLAHAIYKYQIGFINQNREHQQFFGGNLIGVQVIRFKDKDVSRWYEEVLDVDFAELTRAVRSVPTIDHSFLISGDILNLTLMYMIHRFLTASTLGKSVRETAAYNVALVFYYRCICALCADYFRYPADEKVVQAAYANLSNKYLIKRVGTWLKVMEYRAKKLIDPTDSLHRADLEKFNDDSRIVYAINDSQGSIRGYVKNYYAEFMRVHEDGERIGHTKGTTMDVDGEESLKENTKGPEAYLQYARSTIADKPGWVKDNLVAIIAKINTNTSNATIKRTLSWMSDGYSDPKQYPIIDEFLQLVVVQTLYLIEHQIQPSHRRDYAKILLSLKNLYLSTRSTDVELERIRQLGEKMVYAANGKVSVSLMMATRTAMILYTALRVLSGQNAR